MTLIDWSGFLGAGAAWASLVVFLHARSADQAKKDREKTAAEHDAVRRTISDLAHTVRAEFLPRSEFATATREWRDELRNDIRGLGKRIEEASTEIHLRIDRLYDRGKNDNGSGR